MADEPLTGSVAGGRGGAVGAGVAAVAIVCCAAWPVLLTLLGGISVAAALGVGAGVLALIGGAAGVVVLVRRRRARRTSEMDDFDARAMCKG